MLACAAMRLAQSHLMLPSRPRGLSSRLALALCCLSSIALPLIACAPDQASPFSAVVIAWDPGTQVYKLAQVPLRTVTSLRTLQGTSGNVEAGGSVVLSAQRVSAQGATVSSLRAQSFTGIPGPVTIEFNTANGLIYPEDYDALELLSFYAALEKTRAQLAGFGFTNLSASPIFAHTNVRDGNGLSPLGDGELFLAPLNAFFLPPVTAQQQLPPQLNLGAVAHAVGLQAYQQVIWSGAPVDPATAVSPDDPGALTAIHVAQSVRMGIADFLGAIITQDPRWFDHSLQQTAGARALDQLRCGTSAMLQALDVPDSVVPYDPYPLGTVLAYSLWDAAQSGDSTAVATGLLASLSGVAAAQSDNGNKLDLAAALDAVVSATSSDQQGTLCGDFLDRFKSLSVTDLPSCNLIGINAPTQSCQ